MNTYNFIECDGVKIAAFVEGRSQQEEHSSFAPQHVLFYVLRGQINLKTDKKTFIIPKGKMGLVPKFTAGRYFKTWTKHEKSARLYAFAFHDKFIQNILHEYDELKEKEGDNEEPTVITVESNTILKGMFDSIIRHIDAGKNLDKDILNLKTKEAFIGLVKANPRFISIFKQPQLSSKIDLHQFMEENFKLNLPMKVLATLSGRSLSTFQRDFKKEFQTTPHSWLMKKRLNAIKDKMTSERKKPSRLYIEFGFKDLGHFSKAFKKEFNMTPSTFMKTLG